MVSSLSEKVDLLRICSLWGILHVYVRYLVIKLRSKIKVCKGYMYESEGLATWTVNSILEYNRKIITLWKSGRMFRTMIFGLGNIFWASLVAYMEKNLLAIQETWARSLGSEVPLEKEMATHSSILAWRIPRTEKPRALQSMGWQRVRHD